MTGQLLVIAAGGTGGHMFPAQALAEEMIGRGWRVKLSTDERGARYSNGFPAAVVQEVVASATFARGGPISKLMVPLRILKGALSAFIGMGRDRPTVVAGFGGYPAIPAMFAAGWRRVPRLIHEQNGVLGRVNKYFAGRVNAVACGVWPTDLLGKTQGIFTGNPVRAAILRRAGAPYVPPHFGPVRILVIGGSQGARILSDVVPEAITLIPENLRFRLLVTQQARPEDQERVRATYAAIDLESEVTDFIADVPEKLTEAQLVISRAGASSVADITAIGRPSILVPFAAATGDHQNANARGLDEAGATVVIPEAELNAQDLALEIAHILTDAGRAEKMAAAALGLGKPHAARELADLVEGLKKP